MPQPDAQPDSQPDRRVNALVRIAAAAALLVALAVVITLRLQHPSGWVPACPTWSMTGFFCPGCGSTRAVHHLTHARVADAFDHNPALVLLGIPAAIVLAGSLVWIAATGRPATIVRPPKHFGWSIVAIIIIYTIVRNLPGEMFERLRPPETSSAPANVEP